MDSLHGWLQYFKELGAAGQLYLLALIPAIGGEALRADKEGLPFGEIVRRVGIRLAANFSVGMVAMLFGLHFLPDSPLLVGGVACLLALLGADIATARYLKYIERKFGMGDTDNDQKETIP